MSKKTLQEKLRIKAAMIYMNEKVEPYSEVTLMDCAATYINTLQAEIIQLKEQLAEANKDAERFNFAMDSKLKIDKSPLKALFRLNYWCTKKEAIEAIDQAMQANNNKQD